jgi:hypothetical protein
VSARLAILEKALGPDSPSTNLARGNFARLLLDAGNPDEALAIGQTALAAHEKALGQDDPWTKNSAGITAAILDALGRSGEAVALRARYGLEPDAPPAV